MYKYAACLLIIIVSACNIGNNNKKVANEQLVNLTNAIKKNTKDANAYYQRATYYAQNKEDSLALEDILIALKLDSNNTSYNTAALQLLFNKKDPRAIPLIEKLLIANPNDPTAHLKIATIQFYNKNYQPAINSINTALKTDVYNYEAYFLKGMVYKDLKDTANALSSFKTASRINVENAEPYIQLALLSSGKDVNKAILYFESAYKADTTNLEPLNGIGMIYMQRGEIKKAKDAFLRCVNLQKSYPKSFYNLGCVLMDEDSLDKAIRQFDIAIQNDPKYVEAYYNRGLCKEIMKDNKAALADYNQALSINPDFELAQQGKIKVSK
jgi:Tfp pilus assembly protein PilF